MNNFDGRGPFTSREQAQEAFNVSAGPLSIAEVRATLAWMNIGGALVSRGVTPRGWDNEQVKALAGLCDEAQAQTVIEWLRCAVAPPAGRRLVAAGPYSSAGDAIAAFDAQIVVCVTDEPTRRRLARAWLEIALAWHQIALTQWHSSVIDHLAAHAPIELLQTLADWIVRVAQTSTVLVEPAAAGRQLADMPMP